jgi:hypothetical protein
MQCVVLVCRVSEASCNGWVGFLDHCSLYKCLICLAKD